jgi:uncharacterized membrane protein
MKNGSTVLSEELMCFTILSEELMCFTILSEELMGFTVLSEELTCFTALSDIFYMHIVILRHHFEYVSWFILLTRYYLYDQIGG